MSGFRRIATGATWIIGTGIVVSAYSFRPDPFAEKPVDILSGKALETEPILIKLARQVTFFSGAILAKGLLQVANKCVVKQDEHYLEFLRLIRQREDGVPMITVSNHACPIDDPCIFAAMLPFSLAAFRPDLMRFTICAQEICFENSALGTFFGAAKVMPIARGGGINQPMFQYFQNRISAGAWCHVFPEGSCFQTGRVSGRVGEKAMSIGRLKWGVGKMIAHAEKTPIIIPIFHTGMQNVIPLHPDTRKSLSRLPRVGHTITVRCGGKVDVSDLIQAHEKAHGKIIPHCGGYPKCKNIDRQPNVCGCNKDSSKAELELYSLITRRIENSLVALEKEARDELRNSYPELPAEVTKGFSKSDFDPETGRFK